MLDADNPVADMSAYGEPMQQVMLVSIKEMFEITCIAGLAFSLFILLYKHAPFGRWLRKRMPAR